MDMIELLDNLLRTKAVEFHMDVMRHRKGGKIVDLCSCLGEDFHIFHMIHSDLDIPDLGLQYSVELEEKGFRTMIFADPVMLRGDNIDKACILADEVNCRMKSLGTKFVINRITGDIALDAYFPYEVLDLAPELVGKALFDEAVSFWECMHVPYFMFITGKWTIETAVRYVIELMDEGYVLSDEYGL